MNNSLPRKIKQEFIKLKTRGGRRKSSYYVAEGVRCCEEALSYSFDDIECAVVLEGYESIDKIQCLTYVLNHKDFLELAMTDNPQGLILLMKKAVKNELIETIDRFTLVLDGVSEPGNMGTILRTALAVGLKEVVLTSGTVDPYNAKAVRSGMGAQFRMKFFYEKDLASIAEKFPEKKIWLTSPRAESSIYSADFDLEDSFLVFGEEGDGIKDFSYGERVMIPMPGNLESLNVAQAATLFLFEGVRRGLLN